MPESRICSSFRVSLDRLQTQKQLFVRGYLRALETNDKSASQVIQHKKKELEEKILAYQKELEKELFERRIRLEEQYESQVSFLAEYFFLMKDRSSGELGTRDANGAFYRLPPFSVIMNRIREKRETIKMKVDQGFTKLLLVPFAVKPQTMIDLVGTRLGSPQTLLISDVVLRTGATSEVLLYDPVRFSGEIGGEQKAAILKRQSEEGDPFVGWRALLVQAADDGHAIRSVPSEGFGTSVGTVLPRHDICAGLKPAEYMERLQSMKNDPNSPYFAESGMCVDDWLYADAWQIHTTGKRLDLYERNKSSVVYLLGNTFDITYNDGGGSRSTTKVLTACSTSDGVSITQRLVNTGEDYIGARTVVVL